jgi:hypothetical protein
MCRLLVGPGCPGSTGNQTDMGVEGMSYTEHYMPVELTSMQNFPKVRTCDLRLSMKFLKLLHRFFKTFYAILHVNK